MKKIVLALAGAMSLILGITLVLVWWPAVVLFFKGALGMVLALGGILLLYLAGNK